MIRLTALAFALAFAMPATAAPAALAATTPAQAQATPPQAKPKKVCRSDRGTGSIMPKRVCKDADEWSAYDAQNRRDVDNTFDRQAASTAIPH